MKKFYDIYKTEKSYQWNYDNGPVFKEEIPKRVIVDNGIEIFGFKVNSRLGVPAGPLLNSKWIKLYAELGFDIPAYKTVRTIERQSHQIPNCAFVDAKKQLTVDDIGGVIKLSSQNLQNIEDLTITNSFGVPSASPKVWMEDIKKANSYLKAGQVMIVSINGTPDAEDDLATDYAKCAAMAKEAGAMIIEANYSCPNVSSGEGSIYMDSGFSSHISAAIKKEIGDTPLMIKTGAFSTYEELEDMVIENLPYIDGIAGINTMAMNVLNESGEQALPGKGRLKSGLCGYAIRETAQDFTVQLAKIKEMAGRDFVICGVGGMMTVEDLNNRIEVGADIVMSATAAMWDPYLAQRFHSFPGGTTLPINRDRNSP